MKDNCMICGKHLSTPLAKSEGVGPECKNGFSRKIRYCSAGIVRQQYIDELFDELDYDIVVTNKKVWWQTDEAPYTHSISHRIWDAPKVGDSECNVTLTALEELLRMFGYKKIEDVPHPSYVAVSALQNLHTHDREPYWLTIFDAEDLNTLAFTNGEPDDERVSRMLDRVHDELEEDFFPEIHYGSWEPVRGHYRIFSLARRIGGKEGVEALDQVISYDPDESVEIRRHELDMCRDAFERGDLYWGPIENPLEAFNAMFGQLSTTGVYTPLEAEATMLECINDFPEGVDTENLFDHEYLNIKHILDMWVRERKNWHNNVKGA